MKKTIFTFLFAGLLSGMASAHIDLYGIYVRINETSFYCAMISKNLCARVSAPDEGDPNPWQYSWVCYNPNGSVAENFTCSSYTLSEDGGNTIVEYIP